MAFVRDTPIWRTCRLCLLSGQLLMSVVTKLLLEYMLHVTLLHQWEWNVHVGFFFYKDSCITIPCCIYDTWCVVTTVYM